MSTLRTEVGALGSLAAGTVDLFRFNLPDGQFGVRVVVSCYDPAISDVARLELVTGLSVASGVVAAGGIAGAVSSSSGAVTASFLELNITGPVLVIRGNNASLGPCTWQGYAELTSPTGASPG